MLQFDRLRIHGFKSFVDRTELEIAPGLNGIVGPNGCGKSNLVEALRWVMGESSAKRMRGGGMEDVIFNGTDKRSPRNIAEVSLVLNNGERTAPAAYNALDEIEVIRKIERDRGSNYKINGKNTRARDVQMLFADTVTGANSPALVSQGQVAKIINAKPLERRLILEESAGISGLYARRHEAELRLKAAEGNLLRLEDILGGMESRLNGLKRQARQAGRYRNVNAQIRQLETLIAYLEWKALETRYKTTKDSFSHAESIVVEHLAAVTQLTKTHNTQAEDLPALRRAEAELAAALQTQRLSLQKLEDESARLEQLLRDTEAQHTQCETDLTHEQQVLEESSQGLSRTEEEHTRLLTDQEGEDGALEEKHALKETLEGKVEELEQNYNILMQSAAEAKAQRDAAEQRVAGNESRLETLRSRITVTSEELVELKASDEAGAKVEALKIEIEASERALEALKGDEGVNQAALEDSDAVVVKEREALNAFENRKSEFDTEINMLEDFLQEDSEGKAPPVLNDVKPEGGFEKALSRALGDSLMASLERDALTMWQVVARKISDLPALPNGCEALLPHVNAPKTLGAALSQIGVVEDDNQGEALLPQLNPGQALVSKDGSYWRWDGYCIQSGATDRHSQHLEQKNKYHALLKKRPEIEGLLADAKNRLEAVLEEQGQRQAARGEFVQKISQTESALKDLRRQFDALRDSQAKAESERVRLEQVIESAREDESQIEETLKADREALALFEENNESDREARLEELRTGLQEARTAHSDAVRAYDLYVQQQNTLKARIRALGDERVNFQNRTIRARERIKQLSERQAEISEKLKSLRAQPKSFEKDQEILLSKISESEKLRDQAAESLAEREHEVTETAKALKEAEHNLSDAREARAHAQATLSGIQEQIDASEAAIAAKFQVKAHELPQHAALDLTEAHEDLSALNDRKDKLLRERDSIGPVNLRADEEAQELEKEVATLLYERNDLTGAIEELRAAIKKINAEARERLLGAFEHVNAHFQRLFVTLFGGGNAYLALVDTEEVQAKDPLGAGLEIYAQPPGKSLQSLSLLSGGEQTLASIALIFAMFLTNPSPICVLDEIDAPLDDANVDRVCNLLDEISARGETRFLIITHHRLTMARMDRLYGVTMSERGVSQLVSVDLQQSFSFLDEAA